MEQSSHDTLTVKIADDGIGLPADFSTDNHGSLGMSMIMGLSGELDGTCSIESAGGTAISIAFPYHTTLQQERASSLIGKSEHLVS